MPVVHGSCLCGKVAYEVEVPFERFMYCHCSRCRKATGSPHAANGFVKPAAFRWLKGADLVQRYDVREAVRFGLQFCKNCGSKVPHPTRDGALMVIPAGTLDEDPISRPEAAIYWGSRAPWFADCSEMEKYDERPG